MCWITIWEKTEANDKQTFLNSAGLGDPGDGTRYHHYSRSKEHLNIELLKMFFNGKTCRATNI